MCSMLCELVGTFWFFNFESFRVLLSVLGAISLLRFLRLICYVRSSPENLANALIGTLLSESVLPSVIRPEWICTLLVLVSGHQWTENTTTMIRRVVRSYSWNVTAYHKTLLAQLIHLPYDALFRWGVYDGAIKGSIDTCVSSDVYGKEFHGPYTLLYQVLCVLLWRGLGLEVTPSLIHTWWVEAAESTLALCADARVETRKKQIAADFASLSADDQYKDVALLEVITRALRFYRFVLCCAVLCCVVLCCVVLC
jgi:hypothetical protein